MTPKIRLVGTLLAATAMLAGASLSPAQAETRTVHDRAGDGSRGTGPDGPRGFGDIGRVRIHHSLSALQVAVLPAKHGRLGDLYAVYVDTNGSRPGPEFRISTVAELESFTVRPAEGFGWSDTLLCQGEADWRFGPRQSVTVKVPRSCLAVDGRRPHQVRVSVRSMMDYGPADWAPRRHGFGPWVESSRAS